MEFKSIQVYPNPSDGNFEINIEAGNNLFYKVKILNLFGETVFYSNEVKSRKIKLDLSSYPSGIYFVKIKTAENVYIEKIILN